MPSAFDDVVLSDPNRWALFLDIDGTLIDVAAEPGEVRIPQGLPPLLAGLETALGGALALNTGRQLAVVDNMLAPLRLPVAGVHGTEIRLDPHHDAERLAPRVPPQMIDALMHRIGPSDTILIEDKLVGLAVHYRKAPDAVEPLGLTLADVMKGWPAYQLKGGRMVYEIIPRGFSKATAIKLFLQQEPFRRRLPLVIGDDRGDEPAIDIARSMGGAAFTVSGEYFSSREADFSGPTAVRAALSRLLDALVPQQPTAASQG